MLDLKEIQGFMATRELDIEGLARECAVTPEMVASWLAGDAIPRPRKLSKLCEVLGISVENAILKDAADKILVLVHSPDLKDCPALETDRIQDIARCLTTLAPLVIRKTPLAASHLFAPTLDKGYLDSVANHYRIKLKYARGQHGGSVGALIQELRQMNVVIVPTPLGSGDEHRQSASFFHAQTNLAFVMLNLDAPVVDQISALTFHLAACLVFPCAEALDKRAFALALGQRLLSGLLGIKDGALETSVFKGLHAELSLNVNSYVNHCCGKFGDPIFEALAAFQQLEGGRNPAMVRDTLQVSLMDAVELSYAIPRNNFIKK